MEDERSASGLPVPAATLLAMVGLVAVAMVVGNALGIGIDRLSSATVGDLSTVEAVAVSLLTIQGVGILGTALAYLRYTGRWDLVALELPSLRASGLIVVGVVAAFVLASARSALSAVLGLETSSALVSTIGENPAFLAAMAIASLVFVAPIEELLFRSVVQGRLTERYSATVGIVGSSALFASIHIPGMSGEVVGQLLALGGLFAVSAVFAVLYERTGNLVVPWLAHGLYNGLLFALFLLSVLVM